MSTKWNKAEVKFIRRSDRALRYRELAKRLREAGLGPPRSRDAVKHKCDRLGLKSTMRKNGRMQRRMTEDERAVIISVSPKSVNRINDALTEAGHTRWCSRALRRECKAQGITLMGKREGQAYAISLLSDRQYTERARKLSLSSRAGRSFKVVYRKSGQRITVDSLWEAYAYPTIKRLYPDAVFQSDSNAPMFVFRFEGNRRCAYSPDFFIPSENLIIEVKGGFFAWKKWNTVVRPAMWHRNQREWRKCHQVAVLSCDLKKATNSRRKRQIPDRAALDRYLTYEPWYRSKRRLNQQRTSFLFPPDFL